MRERIKRIARVGASLALTGLISACAQREPHIIPDKNVGFLEEGSCSRSRNNPIPMPVEDAIQYSSLIPGRTLDVTGTPRLLEKYIRKDDSGVVTPSGGVVNIEGYALRRVYDLGNGEQNFYVVVDRHATKKVELEDELSSQDPLQGLTTFRGCAATSDEGKIYLRATGN